LINLSGLRFKEYISEEAINKRIVEIAELINNDNTIKNPLFLGILNGSFMFAAKLFESLNIECEISFIKVQSYSDLQSTGNVKEIIGLNQNLENRDVIILEDIVDTGLTLEFILNKLNKMQPKSIAIATLLDKPDARLVQNTIKYVGFSIENKFVVGFGLDFNGLGRNSKAIYVKND
jgi:hypoxanthine phosphoribosyltransferase